MQFENIYLRTFDKLRRDAFSIQEFAKINGLSVESSKVILHRMGNSHQVLKIERGKYILISPKNWIVLESLKKKPKLYKLAIEIYKTFPTLSLILLYGSQVRGDADEYSDYDVLIIVEKPVENRIEIKKEIEKKLGIKLHLTVYSEGAFQVFTISEPYLKFWFKEGIVLDERGIYAQMTKPTAKMGYCENLYEAKVYLEMLSFETRALKRAKFALTALRISLLIEHALELDYDYNNVNKELIEYLGESMKKIRQGSPLSRRELNSLVRVSNKTYKRVNNKIDTVGDNESDIYWKKSKGIK
jgi:predicted nucleotidyltransferase